MKSKTFDVNQIRKLRKIVPVLVLLLIMIFTATGYGQTQGVKPETGENKLFIPSTISDEAKFFYDQVSILEGRFTTPEEWKKASLALEERVMPKQEGAKQVFPGKIQEINICGYKHVMITPHNLDPANNNRVLIYVHGGGYAYFTAQTTLWMSMASAHYSRCRVLSVNYPQMWEKPFPSGRDKVIDIYKELLKEYKPVNMGMFGDSAGGSLIMSAVIKMRDDGIPIPGALGLISPWADLSDAGDSMTINNGYDLLLDKEITLKNPAKLYAGERNLTDPDISPLYGDYTKGFPPCYISTGTRDLFLSTCARLQRKLTDAGIENRLFVYEGMWHVFQAYPMPESVSAWRDMWYFFDTHLAR